MEKRSILFVCMGNICRSPTAEGNLPPARAGRAHRISTSRRLSRNARLPRGHAPDARAQAAARARGVDLGSLRARQIRDSDFESFDLILAMDEGNLSALRHRCPRALQTRLQLFMQYAKPGSVREVPDPYYGGPNGFEHVLDLVEDASRGLLEALLEQRGRG
jgi:protein-tyrosine phosphatase